MASNRTPGSRPGLIHCPHCGEDYSSAYKRCPFCLDYEYEYETERPVRRAAGGKRLASGSSGSAGSSGQGGGYAGVSLLQIISIVFSLAVIVAAVWIVATKLMPVIQRGEVDSIQSSQGETDGDQDPDDGQNTGVTPDDGEEPDTSPSQAGIPEGQLPAGTEPTPPSETSSTPAPASNEASSFKLSSSDVTLEYLGQVWKPDVTFSPAGTTAGLIWESEDTSVVTVTNGTVTAVGLGTTNISAMLPNGYTQTCIVRCKWTEESSSTPEPTQNNSTSGYVINNPDFTFYREGETFRLAVKNYTGGVRWSSSNTSVAAVDSDGTCRAVATGTCTITGTLDDGSTVTAIARVDLTGG